MQYSVNNIDDNNNTKHDVEKDENMEFTRVGQG